MPAKDLLHAVRVHDLSADARQQFKELWAEVLREQGIGQQPVVLGQEGVRRLYLDNASRTTFYDLLKADPHLKSLSFTLGDRRMWRVVDLDWWIEDYKQRQGQLKVRQVA